MRALFEGVQSNQKVEASLDRFLHWEGIYGLEGVIAVQSELTLDSEFGMIIGTYVVETLSK